MFSEPSWLSCPLPGKYPQFPVNSDDGSEALQPPHASVRLVWKDGRQISHPNLSTHFMNDMHPIAARRNQHSDSQVELFRAIATNE